MPVRSDLADGSGRVIERLRFTKLRFDDNIPDSAFEPAVDRRKMRWVRQSPQSEEEMPAWRAAQVPPGFRLSVSGMQALAGAGSPVNHLVYSDGLATVSVFIQTPEPGKAVAQGTTRSGVASAFTTLVDGHQVTAVGEVPPRTLKFIASGLRPPQRRPMPRPPPPRIVTTDGRACRNPGFSSIPARNARSATSSSRSSPQCCRPSKCVMSMKTRRHGDATA
jgi:negative regulator of sigma E activity